MQEMVLHYASHNANATFLHLHYAILKFLALALHCILEIYKLGNTRSA